MTRKQKIASFKLSYGMAMVDSLKRDEPPKSAIWNKLTNLEEHIGRVLDYYRIDQFQREDLDNAAMVFDVLDEKIQEAYP
jgi:hypothetical protein